MGLERNYFIYSIGRRIGGEWPGFMRFVRNPDNQPALLRTLSIADQDQRTSREESMLSDDNAMNYQSYSISPFIHISYNSSLAVFRFSGRH
jgi:hypothetical protein